MAKCRAKHLHTSIQVALWWKSLILIACGANQMRNGESIRRIWNRMDVQKTIKISSNCILSLNSFKTKTFFLPSNC